MNGRQRVLAALDFSPTDAPALEYHLSPAGFHQHGHQLLDLWRRCPDDFGPPDRFSIPPPSSFQPERRDAWGVLWHEKELGAGAIPVEHPLADWSALSSFRCPPIPDSAGDAFDAEQRRSTTLRQSWFQKSGWISLFELMHALRGFENTLMDLADDVPEIHRLANLLTAHHLGMIRYFARRGVDAIQFGDDFGTQDALILSPRLWRRFFQPRYARLVQAARDAGIRTFFHTCGKARQLLDDIADLGVDAVWPQLNTYDLDDLARFSRHRRIAIALHPDRGDLMIRATPADVRRYVQHLADVFEPCRGGSWFYVEIDRGFPFANVEALTTSIAALRHRPSCDTILPDTRTL